MNCEIPRILYLRANTEVPCNCGSGEQVNLGWAIDSSEWSATSLFSNARFQHIKASFLKEEKPWGEVCTRCVFFRPNEPYSDALTTRRLEKVHVELSLACALRCPGCSRVHQAKERKGPVFLPPPVYRRMLKSLRDEGYAVDLFYFCGQGEPLSHPKLEEFITITREYFPDTSLVINTNGNYRFSDVFESGIYPDKLIVSVDGLRQESYEKYRINGDVQTALDFMKDAKRVPVEPIVVEWKYILFTYNDSDEELMASQRFAEELGVDSLQFVVTHTIEHSLRFKAENIEDLPIVSPRAYPELTPHLYFKRPLAETRSATNSALDPTFNGAGRVQLSVDECRYWAGKLILKGWAISMDGKSPRSLLVKSGEHALGEAQLGLVRDDVRDAFPALRNGTAGFSLVCDLPNLSYGTPTDFTFVMNTHGGEAFEFTVHYQFEDAGERVYNSESR